MMTQEESQKYYQSTYPHTEALNQEWQFKTEEN